jgi:hypothetical protein
VNQKFKSIATLDYLKVCYKNNPIQYFTEDWAGNQKQITGHLNKQYISTFYDPETDFSIINKNLRLYNVTSAEKTRTEYYTFAVFFNDVIIGLLFTDSVNQEHSFFKYENSIFYNTYYSLGFINRLLESTFNLQFKHITGFDLAIDTTCNVYSISSPIVYRCESNPYFANLHRVTSEDQKKYARNVKPMWRQSQNCKVYQLETTIYIGDKKLAGKQTKIYNKTEYSKNYQKQFLLKNFNNEVVHRIEVSLSRPLGYDISKMIDFFKLDDQQYLNEIALWLLKPVLKFSRIKTAKIVNIANKLKIENPIKFEPHDMIESIINDYTTIAQEPITKSRNINKMQFKKAVKQCLANELPINRVVSMVENNDLSKNATVNDVEDLNNNKKIAIDIIHSIIKKEVKLVDITIYVRLIQSINAIEVPPSPDITLIIKELLYTNETENI